MPTTDPVLARVAWRAALEAYEAKTRRVRTPEGVRRFGQPIGSLIHPDLPDLPDLPDVKAPAAPRNPAAETSLSDYVRMVATMRDGTAEAVTAHGRWFTPGDRPDDVPAGEPRLCFMNALRLAQERPELTYVEGFGMADIGGGTLFPTHHAWCVDADGVVIDPTWPDGAGYYGVPFKTDAVTGAVLDQGYYGVLGNMPECRKRLENGELPGLIDPDVSGVETTEPNPPSGDDFGADSVIQGPLYHVTGGDAAAAIRANGFEVRKGKAVSQFGTAIYLSDTVTDAHMPYGGGERLTVRVDVRNPLRFTLKGSGEDGEGVLRRAQKAGLRLGPKNTALLKKEERAHGRRVAGYQAETRVLREDLAMDREEFVRSLKQQGYDALVVDGTKSGRQVVVYDADRVRVTPENPPVAAPPTDVSVLEDPGPDLDVDAAHKLLDPERSRRIRKRKSAVKFYAQRRDGRSLDEATGLADEYERAALKEALDAAENGDDGGHDPTPAPKPKKAKLPKVPPAFHPPSGRPSPYESPLTRGGDGPAWGYRSGDEVLAYSHGDFSRYRVIDDSAETSESELWATSSGRYGGARNTGRKRTEHTILLERIPPQKRPDGTPIRSRHPVEDLMPASWETDPVTVDPGFELEASLDALEASELPLERLMPADSYEMLVPILKRKAVALDTATDAYGGYLVPDKLALTRAKEDALRGLGRAFGFDEHETEEAIRTLRDDFLGSWVIRGDINPSRRRMHAAMQHLRRGELADDADTRAMLLQKAWSNATWDRRYKTGETPRISRFVTGSYAAQIEAFVSLSEPHTVRTAGGPFNGETLPPLVNLTDVTVNAWPLTSWTVTPGGVHAGWIGKDRESVELSFPTTREETWLHVWSEEQFRTRGLKAPGEFIVDDRHELNLGRVRVDVHAPEAVQKPWGWGGTDRDRQGATAATIADSVRRGDGKRRVEDVVAAGALLSLGSMRDPLLGRTGLADPADDTVYMYEIWPVRPHEQTVYRHKKTGELYDDGKDHFNRWSPPYGERDAYDAERMIVRDDDGEARLDQAADLVAERGWTYNQLSRLRDAVARFMQERDDEAYFRFRKIPPQWYGPKTATEYERRRRFHDDGWKRAAAELAAAGEAIGVTLDDAWLETQIAVYLKVHAQELDAAADAPVKVST